MMTEVKVDRSTVINKQISLLSFAVLKFRLLCNAAEGLLISSSVSAHHFAWKNSETEATLKGFS
jgi:hypothetical protein